VVFGKRISGKEKYEAAEMGTSGKPIKHRSNHIHEQGKTRKTPRDLSRNAKEEIEPNRVERFVGTGIFVFQQEQPWGLGFSSFLVTETAGAGAGWSLPFSMRVRISEAIVMNA